MTRGNFEIPGIPVPPGSVEAFISSDYLKSLLPISTKPRNRYNHVAEMFSFGCAPHDFV